MYCTVRHKVAISHHLRTLDMEENETMSVGHPMLCKTNKNFIKKASFTDCFDRFIY